MARLGRRQPFRPIIKTIPLGRLLPVSGSASLVLSASGAATVQWPVTAAPSVVFTAVVSTTVEWVVSAAPSLILTAAASSTAEHLVSASASLILTAAVGSTVEWPVSGAAGLVLSATANLTSETAASAAIILAAAGSSTVQWPVDAAASLVLSARANLTHPEDAAASLVLTATAEGIKTALAELTLVFTARAQATGYGKARLILAAQANQTRQVVAPMTLFLSAGAGATTGWPASATVALVLRSHADARGGHRTAVVASQALLLFRARARTPRLALEAPEDYLGRFQQGQDVPLQVQGLGARGNLEVPATLPVARVYREGVLVEGVSFTLQPDAQVPGRFWHNYQLGRLDSPGHYAVLYSYVTEGVVRVGLDAFELLPGGDPAGPAIAVEPVTSPVAQVIVGQVESGQLVAGTNPYLSEGLG